MATYPSLIRVRQDFPADGLADLAGSIDAALARLQGARPIPRGTRIALTAGSRGIARIAEVMTLVSRCLQDQYGALPFIVPAMGSHGGATAASQQALLAELGITESRCGCPIRSSLETVVIDQTPAGVPVYADRWAWEADQILLINRIKPHTDFTGTIQSGLVKMLLLGLGKYNGAQIYHRAFQDHGFDTMVHQVVPRILAADKIWGGVALVENACKELAILEGVPAAHLLQREPELLRVAEAKMARLPLQHLDLLILDEIGKNVSGTGMDTNVVGRKHDDHRAAEDEWPKIRRIAVRGLSAATHGNATGLGMAEFCLERAVQGMDRSVTAINCVTSGHVTAGMIPLVYASDAEMLDQALRTIGLRSPDQARVAWIRNTAELAQIACSPPCLPELQQHSHVSCVGEAEQLPLDPTGMLPPLAQWWGSANGYRSR